MKQSRNGARYESSRLNPTDAAVSLSGGGERLKETMDSSFEYVLICCNLMPNMFCTSWNNFSFWLCYVGFICSRAVLYLPIDYTFYEKRAVLVETSNLLTRLEAAPVIAAVKDDTGFEQSLRGDSEVIFLLYGDVLHINAMVERGRKAGKAIFVHVDLVDGLAAREAAVDFLASATHADGILTTKPQLIRRARQRGLIAIQRCFLLDSMALKNVEKHLNQDKPDLLEILPGLMPKIIRQLSSSVSCQVIAGGLIADKEDVLCAISAGAVAVSSTSPAVWDM